MIYTVIEMQNGSVGGNVWSYTDRNEAESKFHSVLASAAVSSVETHAAVLLSEDGKSLANWCYRHAVEEEEQS